jgi:hypothetical protein
MAIRVSTGRRIRSPASTERFRRVPRHACVPTPRHGVRNDAKKAVPPFRPAR